MPQEREIRASYDQDTIVVYQAFRPQIANVAVNQQRFVAPFSFYRMTWIKPPFLWLMHRSNWGQKAGQAKTLAIRIKRSGWDKALSLGVLTHPEQSIFPKPNDWERQFKAAPIHIQWDTERSIRGAALNHFSIQVGISRQLIREYVNDWIVKIDDVSATVAKIRNFMREGDRKRAKRLLPEERVYQVDAVIARQIQLSS